MHAMKAITGGALQSACKFAMNSIIGEALHSASAKSYHWWRCSQCKCRKLSLGLSSHACDETYHYSSLHSACDDSYQWGHSTHCMCHKHVAFCAPVNTNFNVLHYQFILCILICCISLKFNLLLCDIWVYVLLVPVEFQFCMILVIVLLKVYCNPMISVEKNAVPMYIIPDISIICLSVFSS